MRYTATMLPLGLILTIVGWTAFALAGTGLFFWATRWFPQQPWFARVLLLAFVVLALAARTTKWAIPLIVLLLVAASGFIPRRPARMSTKPARRVKGTVETRIERR